MPDVTLEVSAKLDSITEALKHLSSLAERQKKFFEEMSKSFSKTTIDQTTKVEKQAKQTGSIFKRVLESMRSDMKALASVEALGAGLKLSNMFKGSIEEGVTLGDTVRRLGATFGLATKDFASFQATMMKGLGQIGMSSDVAARALEGLAETPVRGEKNLLEYAKTAGMLAKMGGETGQEAQIGKGMAGVVQARGGNVNDLKQMEDVAQSLRAIQVATGKKSTEALSAMSDMFTHMSADFRKQMGPHQMALLSAGALAAGPNSTKFVEEYLSKSQFQRSFQNATGGSKLFGPQGFNTNAIKQFYEQAKKLGSGDIRVGLHAMGVDSDEAAEGFERLASHLDEVSAAQEKAEKASTNLTQAYQESLGTVEAFKANINKVKGLMATPFAYAQQGITKVLGAESKTTLGSIGTVLAGGAVAAMLTGKGLKGLGAGLLKDEARKKAIEGITGEKVQDVNVVNADEIGESSAEHAEGMMSSLGGKAGKLATGAAGVGSAAAVGYSIGTAINEIPGVSDAVTEGFNKVAHLFGKGYDDKGMAYKPQKVVVEIQHKTPNFKATQKPSRGASQ